MLILAQQTKSQDVIGKPRRGVIFGWPWPAAVLGGTWIGLAPAIPFWSLGTSESQEIYALEWEAP